MNIPLDPRGGGWSFDLFPDEYEPCPTCDGEGAVLSDRPGYLEVCPTCHGASIVPAALLTTEQTSIAGTADRARGGTHGA